MNSTSVKLNKTPCYIFKQIPHDTAIRCRTEEQAEALLNHLVLSGFHWAGLTSCEILTFWNEYKENTCYMINNINKYITFCSASFFEKEGTSIIEFEDAVLKTETEFIESEKKPAKAYAFKTIPVGEAAIRCKTKKQADALLHHLCSNGFIWKKDDTCWNYYRKDTCYRIHENKRIYYGYAKRMPCKVIDFEDVIEPSEEQNTVKSYEDGVNETYQLIKDLYFPTHMLSKDYIACFGKGCQFGYILNNYTASQIMERIKEIPHFEDEVYVCSLCPADVSEYTEERGIILDFDEDKECYTVLMKEGKIVNKKLKELKKTGRKVNISSLFSDI